MAIYRKYRRKQKHSAAKRALLRKGFPFWVAKFATAPAASKVLEALRSGPAYEYQLADRLSYAAVTIRATCLALAKTGQIERNGTNIKRIGQ